MRARRGSKKRWYLFVRDPHCHWCGDAATLDHLVSRLDANGPRTASEGEQTVLACYECNQRRGRENQQRHQRERGSIDGYALS